MSICERFANIGLYLSCTRAAVPNIQFSRFRETGTVRGGIQYGGVQRGYRPPPGFEPVAAYAHQTKCVFYYGVTGSGGNCFHLRYHSQSGTKQHPKKSVRSSSLRWMITTPCVYVGGWLVDPLVPPALHTHGYPCAPCIFRTSVINNSLQKCLLCWLGHYKRKGHTRI